MIRSLLVASMATFALAGCASFGMPEDFGEPEPMAPGTYGFTAEVSGQHQYADGRVVRYVEQVVGVAEVTASGRARVISPAHGVSLRPAPANRRGGMQLSRSGIDDVRRVRLMVEEVRPEPSVRVCVLEAQPGQGSGCLRWEQEYIDRVVRVWRWGNAYLHPL